MPSPVPAFMHNQIPLLLSTAPPVDETVKLTSRNDKSVAVRRRVSLVGPGPLFLEHVELLSQSQLDIIDFR